jgi:DNA-binding NarL/FixJ family response regulator
MQLDLQSSAQVETFVEGGQPGEFDTSTTPPGLLILEALALFQDGNEDGARGCIDALRKSGSLVQLVDLLCPGFSSRWDERAERIRLSVLRPVVHSTVGCREPVKKLLSARQKTVLRLVQEGLSNKEIATRINVSANTVKWHLKEMCRLLGARNRCAVLHVAASKGLI